MITNNRQYQISRVQLRKLRDAVKVFDIKETTKHIKSLALAKAELGALMSEIDDLEAQVKEYEYLKSVNPFHQLQYSIHYYH